MREQGKVIGIETASSTVRSVLDELVREGAQRLLQHAVQAEVDEYIERHKSVRDEHGHQLVVRNGYRDEREIATGAGALKIRQPRVRDRRGAERFTSSILPRYARRSPSIEVLIPVLYLKGISTNDFGEALEAILGQNAKGLSPATITRLIEVWQSEYRLWQQRDLSGMDFLYVWVDGIYTGLRVSPDRPCMLVVVGATADGKKHLLGIADGERESSHSWKELILDFKSRGLTSQPRLAVGDGALGFWAACRDLWPKTAQQTCWVHKTANVLDKLPKRLQAAAKSELHDIYEAAGKQEALKLYAQFGERYGHSYPRAWDSLERVKDRLFTFYDFPSDHWQHIRSTNVIESAFATIRHRQRLTKGNASREAALAMVFKLGIEAEKSWRRLHGHRALTLVLEGVTFLDGVAETSDNQRAAA
jgi:putative transposase